MFALLVPVARMTTRRRYSPARLFIAVVGGLLISWALMYLGEYFGWHWIREVGGGVVRSDWKQ
jgi:hypothetical protein